MSYVTVIRSDEPIARKPHRCEMCDREISPGEKYLRQWNIGDDGPYTWKECGHCVAMVRILDDSYWWDEGVTPYMLDEYEPRTPYEAEIVDQWRARWRDPNGRLVRVPSVKDAS